MTESVGPERTGGIRRWASRLVRVLLTSALIGYVLTLVHFRDSVERPDGTLLEGRVLSVSTEEVTFEAEDGREFRVAPQAVRLGLASILARAVPFYLLLGLGSIAVIHWLSIWRLAVLLRSQGVPVSFFECARWHFVALFYTSFLPGITGGDLVKVYYLIRRYEDRKAASIVTIFVDRVIGMCALAALGGVVLVAQAGDPRLREAGTVVLTFLAASAAGGCVFYSRRVRRLLRVDRIVAQLPFSRILRKLDEAMFLFRYRKPQLAGAFVLAVACHAVGIGMNILLGMALGLDEVGLGHYFVIVPTIVILSSIPVSIGGFGWGEAMYHHFFSALARGSATDLGNRAVALSLTSKAAQILWSLPGGAVLMAGAPRPVATPAASVAPVAPEVVRDEVPERR